MKGQRVVRYSTFLKFSEEKQKEILHRICLEEHRNLIDLITTGAVKPYPQTTIQINYGK